MDGKLNNTKVEDLENALTELERCIKQDPGYISERDMKNLQSISSSLKKDSDYDECFKIALMHHNPVSVPSNEIETHETIINSGLLKKYLDNSEVDLVLYGHRHKAHASVERCIASQNAQGVYYIGAPSLGSTEDARFVEIELEDISCVHKDAPPSALLKAKELARSAGENYHPVAGFDVCEPIDRKMQNQLASIHTIMGRPTEQFTVEKQKSIVSVLRILLCEHDKSLKWSTKENWSEDFHSNMRRYSKLYATDVNDRLTKSSSRFQLYLMQQYIARLESIYLKGDGKLYFSSVIYTAINNTGWEPEIYPLRSYDIVEDNENTSLQIVRVIILDEYSDIDKQWLRKMNFDHMQCGIPLFIINEKNYDNSSVKDLAMGLNEKGEIECCYTYDVDLKEVKKEDRNFANSIKTNFEKMLQSRSLRTANDFLSKSMLLDKEKMEEYSLSYDGSRKSSESICSFISKELPNNREVAVDMGCGTGNYTFELFNYGFTDVTGVDTCRHMLAQAKIKDEKYKIKWIECDFRDVVFNKNVDLITSISSLHYVKSLYQQIVFFKNIYKFLNVGGKAIVEMEFTETLSSMWLDNYFIGLTNYYSSCCHNIDEYKEILLDIGFQNIRICGIEDDGLSDKMIRFGYNNPELYVNSTALDNLPVIRNNYKHEEIISGIGKLKNDISNGSIEEIINKYKDSMSVEGVLSNHNVFFLVAEK